MLWNDACTNEILVVETQVTQEEATNGCQCFDGRAHNTRRYTTGRAGRQRTGHTLAPHTGCGRNTNTNNGAASRRLASAQAPELCTATRMAGPLRVGNKTPDKQGRPNSHHPARGHTLELSSRHTAQVLLSAAPRSACDTHTASHATTHTPSPHSLPPSDQCPLLRVAPRHGPTTSVQLALCGQKARHTRACGSVH